MNAVPATDKYPRFRQLIHWLIGLFVVCQLAIAIVLGQLRSLQYGQYVLGLHRQLGFAILIVSLIRFVAIARHRVASLDKQLPRWQIIAAQFVHFAFYVILIAQPVIGMWIAWARGDTVTAFGLVTIPAPFDISDAARDRLMAAHIAIATALLVLVALHIGAVIFNHWRRRLPVVERMLPSYPADQLVNRTPVAVQLLLALGLVIVIALATGINAIVKYRDFTLMTTNYQETDQAAAEETRAAQSSWKEIVGIASGTSTDAGADRMRKVAADVESHLQAAGAAATDSDIRATIAAVGAKVQELESPNSHLSAKDIAALDGGLQELIDTQSAAQQQTQGDITERAARGHDLIVVTVVPMTLLGVVLALLLARSISSSISRLQLLVRGIEINEGSPNVVVVGNGEFAGLMRGMISMRSAIERRTQDAADERLALESERARVTEEAQIRQRETELQKAAEFQSLQRDTEQRQAIERRTLREELARDFEAQVAGIVDSVAATIATLKSTAANLASSAEITSRSSADASAVAETTKHAASNIAASSTELSLAAQAVRQNAERSKTRAALGAREATAARAEIDLLSVASGEINSIVELIAGVTRQTNLLAINARIEAARAGEAGRGFCIVADEVKTLAAQSREATEGIGGRVDQVGAAANRSIEILQNMRAIISELETSSSSIFAACDDQSKSTDDIVSRVTEISSSTISVAQNIARAEKTARATEAMAAQVVATADELQLQANSLQDQVANFVLQLTAVVSTKQAKSDADISLQSAPRRSARIA